MFFAVVVFTLPLARSLAVLAAASTRFFSLSFFLPCAPPIAFDFPSPCFLLFLLPIFRSDSFSQKTIHAKGREMDNKKM